jgi:hypothetical protein
MTVHERHDATGTPTAVSHGQPCAHCGAPLASDQRWCLNCGRRRPGVSAPPMSARPAAVQPPHGPPPRSPVVIAGRAISPLALGTGLAIFAVALLLGLVIGGDGGGKQVAASPPQVIRVTVPGAAAAAAPASLTSDWPSGQDGFTVQLQALPKDGTEPDRVTQAKADAESKGASDVGALDSDEFPGLDAGNYVIYAGVFDTRKQAARALKRLKGKFAGAKVLKVSAGGGGLAENGDPGALSGKKKEATVGKKQLEQLKKLSPDEYKKKSSKLPDTTKLPGKAPPKDDKAPGGGGGGETIGG